MFRLTEPYKKRPVRFIELLNHEGWRLKVYGIAYNDDIPEAELMAAGKAIAITKLPKLSSTIYGLGYLGIHQGRGANFVFVDWWQDENELHHHVFVSPAGQHDKLEELTHTGLTACVWDLSIMCFERQAWVENIMNNPTGPDAEAYLSKRINEDV